VRPNLSLQSLLPWAAALAALLAIWLLPLPGVLFGQEQLAAERMPETRRTANEAITDFFKARQAYYDFVTSHDMAVISSTLHGALQKAESDPQSIEAEAEVLHWGIQVRDYTVVLAGYAEASDKVFPVLRFYDDELMKYTRSLTPPTEEVRALTFPLADHMRLYPPPIGDLMPDPPWIKADVIRLQLETINGQIDALQAAVTNGNAPGNVPDTLDGLARSVNDIWESGRSVEQVGLQHTKYIDHLQTYETKFQQYLDSHGPNNISATRRVLAYGANIVVGLVLVAGLAFLLMPRRRTTTTGVEA
jgi:tetrahydromethanopterin S-methyltransferase subunit B